ncbi:MAG: hypothetical protein ACWA5P_12800 [bacterium]
MFKKLILPFCFFIVITSCSDSGEVTNDPSAYIPKDTNFIFHTSNLTQIDALTASNELANSLWQELIKDDSIYLTIPADSLKDLKNIFVSKKSEELFLSAIKVSSADSLSLSKSTNSLFILNDDLQKTSSSENSYFNKFINASSVGNQLYLNNASTNNIYKLFYADSTLVNQSETYLRVNGQREQLNFNGIIKHNDSINLIHELYDKSDATNFQLKNITPADALGILAFAIPKNNWSELYISESDSIPTNNSITNTLNSIGVIIGSSNKQIIAGHSIAIETSKDAITPYIVDEISYKTEIIYEVFELNEFNDLPNTLPFNLNIAYVTILDEFILFSSTIEDLEELITAYKNNNVLASNKTFQKIEESLSNEANYFFYANENLYYETFSSLLGLSDFKSRNFKHIALQIIKDDEFDHLNAIISQSYKESLSNKVSEEFTVKLKNDFLRKPSFVINHQTKQKEIVVQDSENILYLISNAGKILWSKKLEGQILGEISQVDLYKNGRLQLTFTTENKWYVLDRNGNEVLPFPKSFNDKITQPLAVFDYDNNRNYRFLITQGDQILLYNRSGKIVKGFNYKKAGELSSTPEHVRYRGKDYIVFVAGNKLKILNRRGQIRIKADTNFDHSGNPVFFYNNKFTTTSKQGELIQVDVYGKFSSSLLTSGQHAISATSKTLVTQRENNLKIKEKSVSLDFGSYTNPQIFYINNKIYVATTDIQAQQVYLYDSQSEVIPNFPVFGQSMIDMDNIDGDKALEIIVKGANNELILYEKY